MGATQSRSKGRSSGKQDCCAGDNCCNPFTGLIITAFIVFGATLVSTGLSTSEVLQRRVMGSYSWLIYTWTMFAVTTSATVICIVLSALGQPVGGRANPHTSNYHPYFNLFGSAWTMTVFMLVSLYRFRFVFSTPELESFDDFTSASWQTLPGLLMLIMWTGIFVLQVALGVITVLTWMNTVNVELHPVVVGGSGGSEAAALRGVDAS